MDTDTRNRIDELLRREIVPATGCTEPAAVALAVAYATSLLTADVCSIEVSLSDNMLKNALGVGIPGTNGMTGLPIAIALGAVLRNPNMGLRLLEDISPEHLEQAKAFCSTDSIKITRSTREDIDKLYIEVSAQDKAGHLAQSIIERTHIGLRALLLDGHPINYQLSSCPEAEVATPKATEDIALSFELVYDYALNASTKSLDFIYHVATINREVAERSFVKPYGHALGRLLHTPRAQSMVGESPLTQMISYTCGACDARMGGAPYTVMSNSGSGNQGITATLPVLIFANTQRIDRITTSRALLLSSLMVIYIKQHLGRLSGLCGMVTSGIGTAVALVYLMGGCKRRSAYAVHNMIGNISGLLCDGAKPSCSLKASTGVSSAMLSALLAMEYESCDEHEGIVHSDVDVSIQNLALIGREGMLATDTQVLNIMLSK